MLPAKPVVDKRYYTKLMDFYRHYPIYIPFLNRIIRSRLSRKVKIDLAAIQENVIGNEKDIENWYREHEFFFGFALYRSGTTFLANLLNNIDHEIIVQHEPNVNDYYYYGRAIQSDSDAICYLKDYRLNEIYFRLNPYTFKTYGEINPFLRRHCKTLKALMPQARFFHLIRNGKDVLRSLMSRELFSFKDPMAKYIYPSTDDPYSEKWDSMTRFEKLCWMWSADNRMMREHLQHTIKFELLLSDYDYFKMKIIDFLEISISSEQWEKCVTEVKNQTLKYRMPAYDNWSKEQRESFERICGEEMEINDYRI